MELQDKSSVSEQENEMYTYIAFPVDTSHISADVFKAMSEGKIFIVGSQEGNMPTNTNENAVVTLNEHEQVSNTENVVEILQETGEPDSEPSNETSKTEQVKSQYAQCKVCDDVMKISKYKQHMAKHRNQKLFNCEQCMEGFNVEDNLKLHMALHSEGDPQCPVCERKFQRYASLKAHLLVHKVEETFNCYECSAEFEREDDYIKHLEDHKTDIITIKNAEKREYICQHCKYTFDNVAEYKEHVTIHSKINKMISSKKSKKKSKVVKSEYRCDTCHKIFTKPNLLERHIRIHTGEKPFICNICARGFTQKNSLKIHMSRHTGERPHKCMLCPAEFAQKGNLRVHVAKAHLLSSNDKVYNCNHCTCIFRTVSALNGHITRLHSDIRELNAILDRGNADVKTEHTTVTNISVVNSSINGIVRQYNIKQRKCGDVRYNLCNLCTKEFKKPSDLIRHLRTHTNEKPFKCNICQSAFALKSTLDAHLGTHAGTRDYNCVLCPKTFPNLKTLNTHYKVHDKNLKAEHTKTFKCSECNKYFLTMDQANAHLEVHVVDEPVLETQENKPDKDLDYVMMKQPLMETTNGLYKFLPPPKSRHSNADIDPYKVRPFKCHLCDAAFSKQVHVKRHMSTHSRKKSFICSTCSKAFSTLYGLSEHQKFHSNIRNYACKLCNKRFITNTILKRHMLLHNPGKPYICPYCKKRFKTVMLCRRHIKVHKKDVISLQAESQEVGDFELMVEDVNLLPEQATTEFEIEQPSQTMSDISVPRGDPPPYEKAADVSVSIDPNQFINMDPNENENPPVEESASYQTIYINYDDLQNSMGSNNLYNSLLPQIKLPVNDSLLSELQDSSNMLFPLDSTISGQESVPSLGTNISYNSQLSVNDLHGASISIPLLSEKDGDIDTFSMGKALSEREKEKEIPLVALESTLINKITSPLKSESILSKLPVDQIIYCQKCEVIIPDHMTHVCENQDPLEDETNLFYKEVNPADIFQEKKTEIEKPSPPRYIVKSPQKPEAKSPSKIIRKGKNNFQCSDCDQSFNSKASVAKHRRKHNRKDPATENICNFCEKKFKKPSDLQRHVRTHTGEKPFACDKCTKTFSLKSTLDSHIRTHIPGGNKEFKCEVCHSYFSSKNSLRVHMIVHTGEKPHQCPICPQKFRTLANKKAHIKAHGRNILKKKPKSNILDELLPTLDVINTDEIPETTQNVDEFFNTEDIANQVEVPENDSTIQLVPFLFNQIQANMILPDGTVTEYPISFGIDGTVNQVISIPSLQETSDNNILATINMESLTDGNKILQVLQEDLSCDACDLKFASDDSLQKHKRLHMLQYACDKCIMVFATQELFEKHVKVHHNDRPFSCDFCDNSFCAEGHLKTHMKRLHNLSA